MKVTKLEGTASEFLVTVCKTHYGHTIDLGQIWLPKNKRREIAAKLQQGLFVYLYINISFVNNLVF